MPSSQLQDPDHKLRHAGKPRAPELPMKRALSEIAQRFARRATTRRKRRGRITRTAIGVRAHC